MQDDWPERDEDTDLEGLVSRLEQIGPQDRFARSILLSACLAMAVKLYRLKMAVNRPKDRKKTLMDRGWTMSWQSRTTWLP